jgi:precorrin-8X/cobalt-precorrin-8 methylmutase
LGDEYSRFKASLHAKLPEVETGNSPVALEYLCRLMLMIDYLRDGDAIYRKSFDIIRAETDLSELPLDLESVAVRLMHACGMTDIVQDLAYSVDAAQVGRAALRAGAPILCDAQMVAYGIIQKRLPVGNSVICTLQEPSVSEIAQKIQNTRSAAAIELWRSHLEGAVVAIGNAPTALFHLLEMIQEGVPKPALILGFPVGFVGAVESKVALTQQQDIPFITLQGRRGGSAMAAAAVNALAGDQEI